MEDLLSRTWEQLIGRLEGPLFFRFLLQPIMAGFFAVRAGLEDARTGKAPYLWTVLSSDEERPNLLRDGWKDVGKVFVLAIALDVAYQLIVFRWIYPVQSLLVAVALAIAPYLVVRGPVTRLAARRRGGKPARSSAS